MKLMNKLKKSIRKENLVTHNFKTFWEVCEKDY